MQSKWPIIIIVTILICICVSAICVLIGGISIIQVFKDNGSLVSIFEVTPNSETGLLPTDIPNEPFQNAYVWPDFNPSALPDPDFKPDLNSIETYDTLKNSAVPNNDLRDLAERLNGIKDIPLTFPDLTRYKVGDQKSFWVTNVDNNHNFQVEATLAYTTDHVYFWIENNQKYNKADLRDLVETFENKIYPTNREFFGSEWTPGIDEDPHLYILYASGLGDNLAGYFSSADSVPPQAHEYSNTHEMFMLNADNLVLNEDFTYGVLAHEFQHMIHWYRDRNEETWLNEGFSEVAAYLNGYYDGGFDYLFASDPDLQLTDWPNDSDTSAPHYGAAFLFVNYFLDHFGEEATKSVVSQPDNGMDSIDEVLTSLGEKDPLTNEPITANDVFTDWVITNYLNDPKIENGRYAYNDYQNAPQAQFTETITSCETGWQDRTVSQYGTDYIRLACDQTYTLNFQGATSVDVIPVDAYSGDYAFWSNKGDESDITLTQQFDFRNTAAPINLSYHAWYDLEKDYDYLYLLASIDGRQWNILTTPTCTNDDPSGNSYGCGFNGESRGWLQESVDLSNYAGKQVYLRFEYVTDAVANGEGFLLDDISIPQIGYFSDFENDDGGWLGEGWVRIHNSLPQTFQLTLLREGQSTEIQKLDLNIDQTLSITIDSSQSDELILIVNGTARFTRQPAYYRFYLNTIDGIIDF